MKLLSEIKKFLQNGCHIFFNMGQNDPQNIKSTEKVHDSLITSCEKSWQLSSNVFRSAYILQRNVWLGGMCLYPQIAFNISKATARLLHSF